MQQRYWVNIRLWKLLKLSLLPCVMFHLSVRRAALDALLLADPEAAFQMCEAAISDQDVDVRCAAVRVLRSLKRPESAALLASALGDKDMLVASHAMEGLVELGDPALPALLDATLPDLLERVRTGDLEGTGLSLGLEAVSRICPRAAREFALELLQEDSRMLRCIAARTLEDVAEPEDWQVLVDLLKRVIDRTTCRSGSGQVKSIALLCLR